ncbi:unnamed protein product [Malus baccata var. baccata]
MVLRDLGFSHSFISEIALYFSDRSCSGFEKIGLILIFAFASLVLFDPINHQEHVCCLFACFLCFRRESTQLKMSWPDLAVNKAVEIGNKNNVTCNVMNYADSVGVRSFRSVKKSIQRLEEAAVSCGAPERLEILRSWVLLLKEVDRLKLSQGSDDVSYNSCDGQPRGWSQATPHNLSWRAQFWPNSIKLGNNWPLAPNPLPCVTQRQGIVIYLSSLPFLLYLALSPGSIQCCKNLLAFSMFDTHTGKQPFFCSCFWFGFFYFYGSLLGKPKHMSGGVLFCTFSLCRYAKTKLTMMKMEDAKPEVSASNNSNSESNDSGLLQD